MRRFWTVLLVLAVAVVIALPAGAAKPKCEVGSSHPSCKPAEEPEAQIGLTCDEVATDHGWDFVPVTWSSDREFTVVLDHHLGACVDLTSAAGEWVIDVQVGSAREVYLSVQDSVFPGDMCWGYGHYDSPEALVTEDVTLYIDLPASTLNACDDPATSNTYDDGDPRLTFNASYAGRRKLVTAVIITVTLPQN